VLKSFYCCCCWWWWCASLVAHTSSNVPSSVNLFMSHNGFLCHDFFVVLVPLLLSIFFLFHCFIMCTRKRMYTDTHTYNVCDENHFNWIEIVINSFELRMETFWLKEAQIFLDRIRDTLLCKWVAKIFEGGCSIFYFCKNYCNISFVLNFSISLDINRGVLGHLRIRPGYWVVASSLVCLEPKIKTTRKRVRRIKILNECVAKVEVRF